ncbi:SDR family NAD(P)-dependent oxidoreductase [Duodenibacillus massiliensis]|uniref:SDR family NAD(P)-dependent oxidoreductase n=1 Tax=Duodenibacillus massiliensis TaxID=1852381 RepID=UPI00093D7E5F|nr:SDR family NAD(P)-dependent oxidoreductase [Duodenibacillus massiliensis]
MKTVAIAGATGGIGQALARVYAGEDSRLLLAGRRLDVLTDQKRLLERMGATVEIDAFDMRDIEAVVRWCQKAVSLNATRVILAGGVSASVEPAFGRDGAVAYYLPEAMTDLERELSVNAVGNVLACNAFVRELMKSCPRGVAGERVQIALVASLAALTGMPGSPGYSASKATLRVYAEALRRLTLGKNIGVTVLFPGFIESDMSRRYQGAKPWLMTAEEGARKMKRAIEAGKSEYAFPKILAIGISLLNLLPEWLQPLFLKGFFFTVQPDHESKTSRR